MLELIITLRLLALSINHGEFQIKKDVALVSSSTIIILAVIMENIAKEKDDDFLNAFTYHLLNFIDSYNGEKEEIDNNKLNELLKDVNLD